MTTALFTAACYPTAPFWALMILAPGWSWTRRVVVSPWIATLPLAVHTVLALPHLGELWPVVSRPDLPTLQAFLAQPYGAAAIWAHLVAFDLRTARWMYLDARERGLSALAVS